MIAIVSPAQASAQQRRPALSLHVTHSRISAGQAARFTYATARVPRAASVVLQRQFGSSHVWRTVRTVTAGKGTVTAPKLTQLGHYVYRLAAREHRKNLAVSGRRSVYAYGHVSMGVLCNGATNVYICGSDFGGTINTGDHTFTYVGQNNGFADAAPPDWDDVFDFGTNSCRSMVVQFASEGDATNDGEVDSVRLIQSTLDPQSASTPIGTVGTMRARLDGTPFSLGANATGGQQVFTNGYADCYTASGQR